jgi:hypothetical protein
MPLWLESIICAVVIVALGTLSGILVPYLLWVSCAMNPTGHGNSRACSAPFASEQAATFPNTW